MLRAGISAQVAQRLDMRRQVFFEKRDDGRRGADALLPLCVGRPGPELQRLQPLDRGGGEGLRGHRAQMERGKVSVQVRRERFLDAVVNQLARLNAPDLVGKRRVIRGDGEAEFPGRYIGERETVAVLPAGYGREKAVVARFQRVAVRDRPWRDRSEEHTSELQSRFGSS